MRNDRMHRIRAGLSILPLLFVVTGAAAQEVSSDDPPQREDIAPSVEDTPQAAPPLDLGHDPKQEMIDLFHRVERKLQEIDLDLADAGAGDLPPGEIENAGLEEFLRSTLAKSSEVQRDIERILELAQQMDQGGGGGGGSTQPPPQGGQSPLDSQRDQGPQGRENTPEAPDSSDEDKDGTQKDSPKGEDSENGNEPGKDEDSQGEHPSNRRGEDPSHPQNRSGRAGDDAEQWGFLPARVREVFQNAGSRDLPVQYRDWIDTYYRRLNRSGSGS